MATEHLYRLASLIRQEKEKLLSEWQEEVRKLPLAHDLDPLTLTDNIPGLLEKLSQEFEKSTDETMIEGLEEEPILHSLERVSLHFDVEEIVAEYNALRGVLQKLIEEYGLNQRGTIHHTLNRIIDRSIGLAVKTFSEQKNLELKKKREEHLSFVTHDLRSPLAAIELAAFNLERSLPAGQTDSSRTSKYLKAIYNNIDRLDELIKKVILEASDLTNSKVAQHRQTINFRSLVDGLLGDLQPLIESSIVTVTNEIPPEIEFPADPNMLSAIFQNLISNAIRYTPHGRIFIGAKKAANFIECWVKDTGTGIPENRVEKIFDKLETDPDRKDGLGLGLAIVKQYVEAHGGTITVQTKVGHGTIFCFTLKDQ